MQKVKSKERILKGAKEKQLVNPQGSFHETVTDFSTETAGQKDWQEILNVMKNKNLQRRLPSKVSFRIKEQIKIFPGKKLKKGFHHHKTSFIRH